MSEHNQEQIETVVMENRFGLFVGSGQQTSEWLDHA